MRQMTRRLAATAVGLSLFLAGSAALGQGYRGGREGAPGRGIRAALAALDLTDAQKEKVRALFESEKPKYETLRQEGRTAREALRAAASAEKPDPAAVGAAFLRVDANRKTVKAERAGSKEKLEALLTAEQKAKLEGWRAAHRQARRGAGGPPNEEGRKQGPPLG
ncbi:MAG: Spy/CpxP family protein refolding chaperone [Holophagales bacterium]|nr:Spy/CpxP family protein refolding chaperone [Holophagales bacterium]